MSKTFKEWETAMCRTMKQIDEAQTDVAFSMSCLSVTADDELYEAWINAMDAVCRLSVTLDNRLKTARRKHYRRAEGRKETTATVAATTMETEVE